jgi:hypothetical protein
MQPDASFGPLDAATMTSFTSHERAAIQAGVQTIHRNVNYW